MFICDISIFNRYGKQQMDERLAPLHLDWRDLVAILVIDQVPGITQARLNPFLQTDKANVTKLLQSLEQRGQITRLEDEADHRSKVCFLTDSGQALVPRLYGLMAEWENHIFQGISPLERAQFEEISQRINANLLGPRPGSDGPPGQ